MTYTGVMMGQGLENREFLVTIMLLAYDALGSSGRRMQDVEVRPLKAEAVMEIMESFLFEAFKKGDSDQAANALNAAAGMVTAGDCSAVPDCGAFNRYPCSTTSATCGECLPDYMGGAGHLNQPCIVMPGVRRRLTAYDLSSYLSNAALQRQGGQESREIARSVPRIGKTGDDCEEDATCLSGLCFLDKCSEAAKQCPVGIPGHAPDSSCSGRGPCNSYTSDGLLMESKCQVEDPFCFTQCDCVTGYGHDCALASARLKELALDARASICENLYRTLAFQDATADNIASRSNLVATTLWDTTVITKYAFANCSAVVIESVYTSPADAVSDDVFPLVVHVVSVLLDMASKVFPQRVPDMVDALAFLANERQKVLALGATDATTVTTDFLKLFVGKYDASQLRADAISLPRTPLEREFDAAPAQVQLLPVNTTTVDTGVALGVSTVQFTRNYMHVQSDALTVRLLTNPVDDGQMIETDKTVVLQNKLSMEYFATPVYVPPPIRCNDSAMPYAVSAQCSSGLTVDLTCTGDRGLLVFTCPFSEFMPTCHVYSDPVSSQLASVAHMYDSVAPIAHECEVEHYSATEVVCRCPSALTHPNGPRLLARRLSDHSPAAIFGTGSIYRAEQFTSTFEVRPELGVEYNTMVVMGMTTSLVVVLLVMGYLLLMDNVASNVIDVKKTELGTSGVYEVGGLEKNFGKPQVMRLPKFLSQLVLPGFGAKRLFLRLYELLLDQHPLLRALGTADALSDKRELAASRKMGAWVLLGARVLSLICASTLLSYSYFRDDGEDCQAHWTKVDCEYELNVFAVEPLCLWTSSAADVSADVLGQYAGACAFRPPTLSAHQLGHSLFVVLVLGAVVDVAVQCLLPYFEGYYADRIRAAERKRKRGTKEDADVITELETWQTRVVTMLRAARLDKMQREMDHVTPANELKMLVETRSKEWYARKPFRFGHVPVLGLVEKILDSCWCRLLNAGDPEAASHLMHFGTSTIKREPLVKKKLLEVRQYTDTLKRDCVILRRTEPQDAFVLKHFVVNLLQGFQGRLARRQLLGEEDMRLMSSGLRNIFGLVLLPICLLVVAAVSFFASTEVGTRATPFLVVNAVLAISLELLVLGVIRILLFKAVLYVLVGTDLFRIHSTLLLRCHTLFDRYRGIMSNSGALIQHFNPACRLARKMPKLMSSRLIMSLGDFDIPRPREARGLLPAVYFYVRPIIVGIISVLTLLPTPATDAICHMVATVGLGCALFYVCQQSGVVVTLVTLVYIALAAVTVYGVRRDTNAAVLEVLMKCDGLDVDMVHTLNAQAQNDDGSVGSLDDLNDFLSPVKRRPESPHLVGLWSTEG